MQARNDMFLRTKAEFEDCVAHGGKCVFLTFTYREKDVPFIEYSLSPDGEMSFNRICRQPDPRYRVNEDLLPFQSMFTFDKTHIQTFFNSLRKFISRKNPDARFRYILVGEYGTDGEFTQRTHYHALLFLDKNIVDMFNGFMCTSSLRFLELCRSFWSYGTVDKSVDCGLVVNNDFACGYVAKYIGKGLDTLHLHRFSRFFEFLKAHKSDIVLPDRDVNDLTDLSLYKYFMRVSGSRLFVMKSKNFGLSLLDDLKPYVEDSEALIKRIDDGVQVIRHSRSQRLRYPKYILRKLFYKFRADGTYYLSDLGLRTSFHVYKKYIDDAVSCLNDLTVSIPFIQRVLSCDTSEAARVYDSISLIRSNPYGFFTYSFLLRGRVFPRDCLFYNVDSLPMSDNLLFTCDATNYESFLDYLLSVSYASHNHSDYYYDGKFCSVSDTRDDSSLSLSDFMDLSPGAYSRPFSVGSFDVAYTHYNRLVNTMRGSLLAHYAELNEKAKKFKDIMCFEAYGLPA